MTHLPLSQRFTRYLEQSGQTQSSFARRVGLSPHYLSEIIAGKKVPSLRTALAISLASGKLFSATCWIEESPSNSDTIVAHSEKQA